jgi:hypothetical protein
MPQYCFSIFLLYMSFTIVPHPTYQDQDIRVEPLELIEVIGDQGTVENLFAMHLFHHPSRAIQPGNGDTEFLVPWSREGFAVSLIDPVDNNKLQILFARPLVRMHVPAFRDWEPIEHIGTIWWDNRTAVLWIAVAVTTNQQSMIQLHKLAIERDPETDVLVPMSYDELPTFTHQVNQNRGQPDRVTKLDIVPDDDGESVTLRLTRHDMEAPPINIPVDEAKMREFPGIKIDALAEVIRKDCVDSTTPL